MKPDELLKLLRSYKFECCGVDYSAEAADVVEKLINVAAAAREFDWFSKQVESRNFTITPETLEAVRIGGTNRRLAIRQALVALDGDNS